MLEERSAGAVLYFKDKLGLQFLLLHYPSGHWDFVKGKIEPKEEPEQTVIRETREETGITDLEIIDGFKEKIEYNFQFDKNQIHKEVIFYLAKTGTKEINISHEHQGYQWLSFDDAINKTTYQNAKKLLRKARNLLNST